MPAASVTHLDERRTSSPALSALTRKRAELAGEAEALRTRIAKLQADLAHLDAAIRIMDPEAEPESIRPLVRAGRAVPAEPGDATPSVRAHDSHGDRPRGRR